VYTVVVRVGVYAGEDAEERIEGIIKAYEVARPPARSIAYEPTELVKIVDEYIALFVPINSLDSYLELTGFGGILPFWIASSIGPLRANSVFNMAELGIQTAYIQPSLDVVLMLIAGPDYWTFVKLPDETIAYPFYALEWAPVARPH